MFYSSLSRIAPTILDRHSRDWSNKNFESQGQTVMNKITEYLIGRIVERQGDKCVGTPTNMPIIDFNFRQETLNLPKFEKSTITTIK